MHHTARTILFTAAWILTTAIFAADPVATASSQPVYTTTLTQSCGTTIVREHAYDPNHGYAEIAALEQLNTELESLLRRGKLTTNMWEEMGLVSFPTKEQLLQEFFESNPAMDDAKRHWLRGEMRENRVAVAARTRKRDEVTGVEEVKDSYRVEPYKQVNFKAAMTGIYLHERALTEFDKRGFDATMLALPGIGFFGSKAASMLIPSNVFVKGADPALPTIAHKGNKRLKVLMIPVDTSLNGMQAKAPIAFASSRGVRAVTRHIDLYVRTRFPGLPRFALGRSQGALNVLETALHVSDMATIGMNPSFPADDVILHSIYKYEHQGPASGLSSMADVVDRAWEAHHIYTPQFEALRTGTGSKSPSLIILGEGDPSYPDYYPGRVQSWANLQPDLRSVARLTIPEEERKAKPTVVHTLLLYDCKKTFSMTINTIGHFIVNHLETMEQRQRDWFEQPQ